MLTQTQLTESNRNDRWAKLHKACQLSAQCRYTRHDWGIIMNSRSAWLIGRITRQIAILRHLRRIDKLHTT